MTYIKEHAEPNRWEPTELAANLLSPGSRKVVHCWLTETRFLEVHGEPAILLLVADEPASFEELVRCTEAELSPDRVMHELLASGLATLCHERSEILLRRTAYRPADGNSRSRRSGYPAPDGASGKGTGLRRRFTDYGYNG